MKYFFLMLCCCVSTCIINAQSVTWELSAAPGNQASNNSVLQAPGFNTGVLTRGAGLTAAAGTGSMNASGWYSGATPTTLDDAISNDDYYEFSLSSTTCIFFDADSIRIVLQSSADGPGLVTLRSSSDNFGSNIASFFVTTTATAYTFGSDNLPFTEELTFRLYGFGDPAGGGTPSPGGTMRIGSSTVATDNDLEVFATSSPLAFFNAQSNLTVTALSSVGSIPFNTIIPGSTISWSRTPESIGDVPLSGTGNIPGFTSTNNTGAPLVCTFTVNATLGNCTSADMLFTITVNPPPAAVPCTGSIAAWELSMEPGDQLTSESFFSETGIGACILTRGAGLTPQPLPQGMSTTNWFDSNVATTLAQAIANNDYYEISLPVDAAHQANVTGVRFILRGNPGSPKNLALRSSTDNFANTLASASLTINDLITNFNFTAVSQSNGTLIFRLYAFGGAINNNFQPNPNAGVLLGYSSTPASPDICVFGTTGVATCDVTGLDFTNDSSCNNNGTPDDPDDDFYTSDIVVDFTLPPAGSNLILEGVSLIGSYSIPVANLLGNSHTFNDVHLKANGLSTSLTARFTNASSCGTQSRTQPGVPPCSGICEFTSIGLDNVLCNDNGTPSNPDDDYITFSLDPEGNNFDSGYEFVSVPGFPAPTQLDGSPALNMAYGSATTFRTANGTSSGLGGVYEIMIMDDSGDCNFTETIAAPGSCSGNAPCSIASVTFNNTSACDDNGTNDPVDDFFFADVQISFVNPPATGLLSVSGGDLVDGTFTETIANVLATGSPFTFFNKKFKADGNPAQVTAAFTASQGCTLVATGPTVGPCSFPAPVISCPAAATVTCAGEVPVVNPASVSETHSCSGNVTITPIGDVISNQTCVNRFTITRTYQAADQCGNITSCSQTITVNDQTIPVTFCPLPVTVSCLNLVPPSNFIGGTLSDNCGGVVTVAHVGDALSNQTCANRFTITRTYRGTDLCGNSGNCTQTIIVNDQTAPGLTCPASQTVSCANQVPLQNIALVTGLGDNCGGATPTVTFVNEAITNQTCVNRFTLTRTYRATDACGNSATCSQVITVNDQTGPALSCPASQTVSCANQVPLPNIALVTGSDNCGGTSPTITFGGDAISNQTCANRFTLTRTYRSTDACNNSATCSQIITVNDQTPPIFQNPPTNVTVDCYLVPAPAQVNASDNCGSATVTYQGEVKTPGTCPVYYILTRTWLATDVCGNTATTVQVITVTDDRAPQFIMQPKDVLIECAPDNDLTFQAWLDAQGGAVAEDCSPIAFSYDDSPVAGGSYVACGNTFQRTIRFTATDDCGNVSFRDATFTVLDLTPPVFTHLPEDRSVPCSNSGDGSVELYEWLDNQAFLTVEDQCGAVELEIKLTGSESGCGNTWTKKYKFTATDDCGNTTTVYATFSVIDDKPPVITACPPDNLYLTCAAKIPAPDPSGVIATDQCGSVTVAVTDVQQWGNGCSSSPMTVNYTYTATDECGNKTACFQHLRVLDNSAAEINIPDTVEVICVDDIPGQYAVEAYLLALLDGPCNATKIAVLQDLGLNGNSHSYRIQGRDGCRNKAAEQIVTFVATGVCSPLCSATSEIWGSPGVNISFPPITAVIDSVTSWYGGVKAGSFGRTLTVGGSDCFAALIGTGGDCSIFAAGQHVANDNNGCQLPASMLKSDGTLASELGANVLALQLNIWYNLHFNHRDLGVQDLKDLPACMVDYSIMKSLGNHSTWQDLLNLANEYLGSANAYPYPDGFCELLNAAIANVNVLHQNCMPVPPCNNAHKESGERGNLTMTAASLVPNPATDRTMLWYNALSDGTLTIRIMGINATASIQEINVRKGMNQIELSLEQLSAGIYTIHLRQGDDGVSMRLVKVMDR